MYIANQLRDGDPTVFFSHENQVHPPSLSIGGKLRLTSSKSKLLTCLDTNGQGEPPAHIDCKIFDGAALVHGLPTSSVSTFEDYARTVFKPILDRELTGIKRLDLVWDRYLACSIKESTRQKRGSGLRRKVAPTTKMPANWKDFLQDSTNKEELFAFLTQRVAELECPKEKELYVTSGTSVIARGDCEPMADCTHEEADTRITVHLQHAVERGSRKIVIRTVDTDVLVILIGQFPSLFIEHPDIDIWVAFGVGKNFCHYNINNICKHLGDDKSRALPLFHAYTGCDTTSCFLGKGKKSAWRVWKSYPEVTQAFLHFVDHPFQAVDVSSEHISCLERFTVLMYDVTSNLVSVNEARRELFCKRKRNLENIPPTQDALLQHIKRVLYQSGIWTTCRQAQSAVPSPEGWGWTMEDGHWAPVWLTIPEAAKACKELIKCGCRAEAGCVSRCKCSKAGLPCTELCSCCCQK
ncbi:uncharacterized protein [Diadema antillarum]|uniref:uncharacterized protein n=1 Tax=Diadema antillarum TaxID=105358 RepID=UPI003A8BD8B6